MEHDLEKIKRRSQLNALMSLLSALLVIGSLVFSFYTLNRMEKKRDALDKEIAKKQAQFDKIGQMLVAASQEENSSINHSIDEATQYFLEVKKAEGGLTVSEELAYLQSVDASVLSAEQKKRKRELEEQVENNATIQDKSKIVTCTNIVEKQAQGIQSEFNAGDKVYFHAQINSPGNETIRAAWKKDDEEFHAKNFDIGVNTGNGFKIWDFKQIREAGTYSIMLYNSSDLLIGKTNFSVE